MEFLPSQVAALDLPPAYAGWDAYSIFGENLQWIYERIAKAA